MASSSFAVSPEHLAESSCSEVLQDMGSKLEHFAAVVIFAVVNLAVSIGVCTAVFSALAN